MTIFDLANWKNEVKNRTFKKICEFQMPGPVLRIGDGYAQGYESCAL